MPVYGISHEKYRSSFVRFLLFFLFFFYFHQSHGQDSKPTTILVRFSTPFTYVATRTPGERGPFFLVRIGQ